MSKTADRLINMSFLTAAVVFFAGFLLALAFWLVTGSKECFKTCLPLGMAAAMLVLAVCAAIACFLEYKETHRASDLFAGYIFSGGFFAICLFFVLVVLGKEALLAGTIIMFAVCYLIVTSAAVALLRMKVKARPQT
jgi:hypothetical protein